MCACGRQRRPALALIALSLLVSLACAHQSLSKISMSRNVACRVGFGQNCPGPCPNTRRDFRLDMNRDNPAMTVRRGQRVLFRTLMNNHEGGFSRWTLVHARGKDMWSHKTHAKNAFLWSCGDTGRQKCSSRYQFRDCYYDRSRHHYSHYVTIPKIYPDGIYVLGWVWFGGGGTWGFFGDYYDCAYIRIKGGAPVKWQHRPEFIPGDSRLAKDGKCTATVNRVGVCWREPCPGGGRYTKLFKPASFTNKVPKPLYRWMFKHPYRIAKSNVRVKSMTIRPAWNPKIIIHRSANTAESRHPYLHILEKHGITITCETEGPVKHVTFYTNGKIGRTDRSAPYSIAGDWEQGWKTFVTKYSRWRFRVDYRVTTISCKAVGYGAKNIAWHTMELSTK